VWVIDPQGAFEVLDQSVAMLARRGIAALLEAHVISW
jgi:hypothetical protein